MTRRQENLMMESKKKISQKRKYHNKTLIKLIIKGFVTFDWPTQNEV